jgi:hypothetical protein
VVARAGEQATASHDTEQLERCLEIELREDGWAKLIRLSGCTLRDARELCQLAVGKEPVPMTGHDSGPDTGTAVDVRDHQSLRCLEIDLEEDGTVHLIRFSGCSLEEARELCRLVVEVDPLVVSWLEPSDK